MSRSVKKGPYVAPNLERKLKALADGKIKGAIKTWSRSSVVRPDMVGLTIEIHNGRKFMPVYLTENMVGHYLGEFVATRTFRMHSGQRQQQKGGTGVGGKK